MSVFVEIVERMPRVLLWTAAAHVAVALVCLLAWRVEVPLVGGAHPALKPLKFGVSIALFLGTMGALIPRLSAPPAVHGALAWTLAVTMVVEMVPIVGQSLRGTASHFNTGGPLDRAAWAAMVLAIVVATVALVGTTLLATVRPLVGADGDALSPLSTWAWRLGLWLLLLAPLTGFLMGGRLQHSVGGADGGPGLPLAGWSVLHGDLRVVHFFALHALQVLPAAAWGLERVLSLSWARWTLGGVVALAMCATCIGTLVQALAGRPFVRERIVRTAARPVGEVVLATRGPPPRPVLGPTERPPSAIRSTGAED